MAAIVQMVSAVGVGGSVLLDLNAAPSGKGVYLGDRGQVQLADVAMADRVGGTRFLWSAAADGGSPGELASRQITVPFVLVGSTPDQASALVGALRRLTSSRFILKLQRHGSTVPVWLRCLPCAPKLSSNVAAAGQPTTMVTGSFTAQTEPYALGARVDVASTTITQNPASGTPFVMDINGVPGDGLTPLVLRSADTDVLGQVDRLFITVRRRGVPSALTGLVVQGESATTTLGATPPTVATFTGDSTFSGSSGVRATYATGASGPWTATAAFTGLSGVEAPGLYRLLVRCRRGGAAASSLFSLVAQVGPQRMVETFTAAGNDLRVIDMGIVQPRAPHRDGPVRNWVAIRTVTAIPVVDGSGATAARVYDYPPSLGPLTELVNSAGTAVAGRALVTIGGLADV